MPIDTLSLHQSFASIHGAPVKRLLAIAARCIRHPTSTKTLLHKTAAPRRSSQGQLAAGPSAPRQLAAALPSNGERRYSQPAEPRSAPRPGMGLEGGQQGGGPTAEQRCHSCHLSLICYLMRSGLCVPATYQYTLPFVLLPKCSHIGTQDKLTAAVHSFAHANCQN